MGNSWTALLYHGVIEGNPNLSGGPDYFAVSEKTLRQQLAEISRRGLVGCSVEEAVTRPSRPQVAISFDDGEIGQYKLAFPALVEMGMTATFFITTAWIGKSGYVTWGNLEKMKAAGMSIQSHTQTHPFLSELGADALRRELVGSKQELDSRLGQDAISISLPGGDPPRQALQALIREAGYQIVCTSRWGANVSGVGDDHSVVFLRRCTVRGEPSIDQFVRIVTGDVWVAIIRQVRDATLRCVRRSMGLTRYSRLRRRVLDYAARRRP